MAVSPKSLLRIVIPVAALLVAMGCGSSEPEAASSAAADEPRVAGATPSPSAPGNTAPRIDDVRFEPEEPVPGPPLRALVSATDAEGDDVWFEFEWRIDGRDAGEKGQGRDLDLAGASKGQTVEVIVTASDGKSRSEPYDARVELENRAPEIVEINVEPGREVVSGTPVVALPSATDADGDAITYHYEWTVNGREHRAEGALLETKRMRRGDQIRLRVVASDGEAESEPVELPTLVVVNSPPRIVSHPPSDLPGGVFRYPVSAQDPDGDPHIEFRLEGAPSGMAIDPYSGVITWAPLPDQTGEHTVTVFAQDLHEGVGEQEFEVRVSAPPQDTQPAKAAE